MRMMWHRVKNALGFRAPTESEMVARSAFREGHPEQVAWTTPAADEDSRCVVGVFYWWGGKPPRYRFYAVDKATMTAMELHDDSAYRPKNWR